MADGARSSLDTATKLDRAQVPNVVEGRWLLNLYPDAAEAGGCFQSAARFGSGGSAVEPEPGRAAIEAARRARGHIRRYCTANRLNRLGTLTYRGTGCHDPVAFRADVADFFRTLRARGRDRFPYLWVPEWHPGGHGLHGHFVVGRFIPVGHIRTAWGRGHVHITMLNDLPTGSGALGEARLAARYIAKYVGKDVGSGGGPVGLHRYEVAQGFQPRVRRLTGPTLDAVLDKASEIMGSRPVSVWDSADADDWGGPHAVSARWDA
jgi:hypothetical protein